MSVSDYFLRVLVNLTCCVKHVRKGLRGGRGWRRAAIGPVRPRRPPRDFTGIPKGPGLHPPLKYGLWSHFIHQADRNTTLRVTDGQCTPG